MTATPGIQTVRVDLGPRSYDIRIGPGILDEVADSLRAAAPDVSHAVVITDAHVEDPHGTGAAGRLAEGGLDVDLVVVEPGETSKSVDAAAELWDKLLEIGADRKTVIVAVGGGVIGDLAGFAAATYARGIRFFQVPTTLLAQVDSSVGGKVGINLPGAKNMVGAFLQPVGVLIDTLTLRTLPEREYVSGLGEVVKYGVALDAALFDELEASVPALLARDDRLLARVIARCCRLKADVVQQDEREESGLRAVLNYGHTFGHALEALCGYGTLLHGEAVAIGMVCAAALAERLGRTGPDLARRQRGLLAALGLPVDLPQVDPDRVVETMMHDKKAEHGRLRFVLPDRLGHAELVDRVDAVPVRAVLANP